MNFELIINAISIQNTIQMINAISIQNAFQMLHAHAYMCLDHICMCYDAIYTNYAYF